MQNKMHWNVIIIIVVVPKTFCLWLSLLLFKVKLGLSLLFQETCLSASVTVKTVSFVPRNFACLPPLLLKLLFQETCLSASFTVKTGDLAVCLSCSKKLACLPLLLFKTMVTWLAVSVCLPLLVLLLKLWWCGCVSLLYQETLPISLCYCVKLC